MFGKGIYFAD